VLTGPNVILVLKIAVAAVSVLLAASIACAALGRYRWHGRINIVFFVLTLSAVLGLEAIIRFIDPTIFDNYGAEFHRIMSIHLRFSIPSAVLLPFMLLTGLMHRRTIHLMIGACFLVCWIGTFYTGIFLLPQSPS
jgi:hypothetical protein